MAPRTIFFLDSYLSDLSVQSEKTSETAKFSLLDYAKYVKEEHSSTVQDHVEKLRAKTIDVYQDLRLFVAFLDRTKLKTRLNSPNTVQQKVKYVKRFLEYSDVDISATKFRLKIKMPKAIKTEKSPLDKKTVQHILSSCDDIRLRTYLLWLAAMGWRALESINVRWEYLDLECDPAVAFIPGEFTKTRTDRRRFMTRELVEHLRLLKSFNYRTRNNVKLNRATGKYETVIVEPKFDMHDYVFLPFRQGKSGKDDDRNLDFVYNNLRLRFSELLKRLGYDDHQVTFHSFRRFVYSEITSLGYNQFAEYWIGHAHSEYWSRPEKEKIELFNKVQAYLTYLDVGALSAATAETNSKVEALEQDRQDLHRQIRELREMVIMFQQEKYAKGEIVMEDVPEIAAKKASKKREKL